MKKTLMLFLYASLISAASCTKVKTDDGRLPADADVRFTDVVDVLSSSSLELSQVREVHDAVSASLSNGYDQEYTMRDMFESPGRGVGDSSLGTKAEDRSARYSKPLRELFYEYYGKKTKAGGDGLSAQDYLNYISGSDMQIYWPYSENWDGKQLPVISFDPLNGSSSNVGYYMDEKGKMQKVNVTEEMAKQRPVWIVNNNDDSRHMTLDVLRKKNPDWVEGGNIRIETKASASDDGPVKSLILKDFTMTRNYDNWFQGASEFFVKIGSIESFTAKVENDIYLYNPSITDFIVVIKRSQLGKAVPLNTLLVSDWTQQLQSCAFMIIEDDGGEMTSWNCSAVVKYNSKSYGFEMSIPYRSRDDIVWRGNLSRRYIEAGGDVSHNFGDVRLTFSIVDVK
ncbi:MAG: hypothetical protein MJY92_01525 [Bacteroidales bacterium]|nr:hypothetical protein [Bacteroidales bacterium]